ncbi:HAMP domain-containing histidine kinase [Parvibaculum lavamentivorans]|nr:HAMP domain-containing histidine kinase [Parvibaculum lavamentivorans]
MVETCKESATASLRQLSLRHGITEIDFQIYSKTGRKVKIRERLYFEQTRQSVALSHWFYREDGDWQYASVQCTSKNTSISPLSDGQTDRQTIVAAAILHESKQPLSIISLATANAMEKLEEQASSDVHEYVNKKLIKIRSAVERMLELSDSISQMASGEQPALDYCLVSNVAREAVNLFHDGVLLSTVEVDLDLELLEDASSVRGDANLLKHAILNLLTNAYQSILERQEQASVPFIGKIVVKTACFNKRVCISIRDNGVGLMAENEINLFEPFVTNKSGGSGVGLAFVKEVVAAGGGTVRCRNVGDGAGAIFEIELPTYTAPEASLRSNLSDVTSGAYISDGLHSRLHLAAQSIAE